MQQRKRAAATNVSYFHVAFALATPFLYFIFFRILCAIELFFCIPIVSQLFRW